MNFRYVCIAGTMLLIATYAFLMQSAGQQNQLMRQEPVPHNVLPDELLHRAHQILVNAEEQDRVPTLAEYTQARLIFEIVANQQNDLTSAADANLQLGLFYKEGLGVPVNRAQARMYILRAAQQRIDIRRAISAHVLLGNMFSEVDQPDRNVNDAIQHYTEAVTLADQHGIRLEMVCLAHLSLGEIYKDQQGNTPAAYAQARAHFQRLIDQRAQFPDYAVSASIALADMFFDGPEVTGVDYNQACQLYDYAIASQNIGMDDKVHALVMRGKLYYEGSNGVSDFPRALQCFNAALNIVGQGHWAEYEHIAIADYYLGLMYAHGQGVPQNFQMAHAHFRRLIQNQEAPEDLQEAAQAYLNRMRQ